jgi:hypothetical protein
MESSDGKLQEKYHDNVVDALLNIVQIAQAIRMGERGLTQKELAAEFGCSVEKVVRSLSAVGVRLEPKPFGMRPVTVRLSGAQVEGLRAVADLQGIRGVDRHSAIAEQALRRLGADAPLLRATMDPTFRPVFLEGDDVARLKDEAGKRGITPDALAGLIVSIVLRDRMVAAVIDG